MQYGVQQLTMQNFLSPRFHEALELASCLHEDQARKGGNNVPYVAHLLGVTARVLKAGGKEEQAIAALLHDSIEDQGHKITAEEIASRFGATVADIVVKCTDASAEEKVQMDWWDRKRRYLAHIATLDSEAMLVVVADKLENATDILWDRGLVGEQVWERFSQGKAGEVWFYGDVVRIVGEWIACHPPQSPAFGALVAELRRVVTTFSAP